MALLEAMAQVDLILMWEDDRISVVPLVRHLLSIATHPAGAVLGPGRDNAAGSLFLRGWLGFVCS